MNSYEALLLEADDLKLITKEKDLLSSDGRIKDNKIAIRKGLTSAKKKCVLAEELGHYHLTVGNIIDQDNFNNQKQEQIARCWAYKKLITLEKLIEAFNYGCRNQFEYAEYLGVTEQFLIDAMERFKTKYGCYKHVGSYTIMFYPHYGIIRNL